MYARSMFSVPSVARLRWHGYRALSATAMVWSRYLPGGRFDCPLCGYHGHFASLFAESGRRQHARCPKCRALERHRLQVLVMRENFEGGSGRLGSILHVAPEPAISRDIQKLTGNYVSADILEGRADVTADLRNLKGMEDCSFDIVYASHVLEHIDDDMSALREVYRVLKQGGTAILPVPTVCNTTVEYGAPSPNEEMHVRAVGLDYFSRFEKVFDSVELFSSRQFPDRFQTWVYENRERFPNKRIPLRPPQEGTRHEEIVPLCRKSTVRPEMRP